MNICLNPMARALCQNFFQEYTADPDLCADKRDWKPYVYSTAKSDAYFARQKRLGRIHLAVMLDEEPIGKVILKNIDHEVKHCTLSITMKNDRWKNRGYGTQAEILTLEYAFGKFQMETVYADAVRTNKRSQYVLQKVGFTETHQDDTFCYYRCDRSSWNRP